MGFKTMPNGKKVFIADNPAPNSSEKDDRFEVKKKPAESN